MMIMIFFFSMPQKVIVKDVFFQADECILNDCIYKIWVSLFMIVFTAT